MSDAFWIIATGSLIALSCALVGNYLVLRKQAMLGDALSHAILPGIVIAYMLSGMNNTWAYLIACSSIGVLSIALIDFFKRQQHLGGDLAIGLSFTGLFALGIIMISLFASKVHLDFDHVLYGEIAYVPLDLIESSFSFFRVPRSFWISLCIFIFIAGFITLSYRILNITSFSPELAKLYGIRPQLWHYVFLSLVSVVVVSSFESVGAILVVAFLVIPPSTAFLLSKSMPKMIFYSCLIALASAFGGYYMADFLNSSIAASMAVFSGGIFMLSFSLKLLLSKLR